MRDAAELNCAEFVQALKSELDAMVEHWAAHRTSSPEVFPERMGRDEWVEFLGVFCLSACPGDAGASEGERRPSA